MNILNDLLFFLYPYKCEVCGRLLTGGESVICSCCNLNLPRTNYHRDDLNPVVQRFWGRVNILHASSYFYFYKGSPYQSLLHKLKYKGQKEIGVTLGKMYAAELLPSVFSASDIIIPVPLHPKKLKKRGFNQSEMIARGFTEIFKGELRTDLLIRTGYHSSQTEKGRYDRFLNMQEQFAIKNPEELKDKSILLIDDVITTGSTIEACAMALETSNCAEINVLSLALA